MRGSHSKKGTNYGIMDFGLNLDNCRTYWFDSTDVGVPEIDAIIKKNHKKKLPAFKNYEYFDMAWLKLMADLYFDHIYWVDAK